MKPQKNPDNVYMLCFESQAHYRGLGQMMTQRQTHIHLDHTVFRQLIVELFIKNIDQMLAQTKARVIFFHQEKLTT